MSLTLFELQGLAEECLLSQPQKEETALTKVPYVHGVSIRILLFSRVSYYDLASQESKQKLFAPLLSITLLNEKVINPVALLSTLAQYQSLPRPDISLCSFYQTYTTGI